MWNVRTNGERPKRSGRCRKKKVVGVFFLRWKGPGRPFGVALYKRKRETAGLAQYGTRTASSQAADELSVAADTGHFDPVSLRQIAVVVVDSGVVIQ